MLSLLMMSSGRHSLWGAVKKTSSTDDKVQRSKMARGSAISHPAKERAKRPRVGIASARTRVFLYRVRWFS